MKLKDMLKEVPANLPMSKPLPNGPKRIELSPEDCRALCDLAGITYMPDYEKRVLEYVITNEATDRSGDIVRAAGMNLDSFKKEPVIHLAHDTHHFPVGTAIKTWYDPNSKSIKSWALFLDDRVDRTQLSDTAFRFASNGHMKGASVGFLPKESYIPKSQKEREELGLGSNGIEYRASELLEYSVCTVPCNPQALTQLSKSASPDDKIVYDMHQKIKSLEIGGKEDMIDKDMHDKLDVITQALAAHNEETKVELASHKAKIAELESALAMHKDTSDTMHKAHKSDTDILLGLIKGMLDQKPVEDGAAGNKSFYDGLMDGLSTFRKTIN
jgi:hypothetical protein